ARSQNPFQQCHLDQRHPVYDHGHLKLLPQHPLAQPEYIRMSIHDTPDEIIIEYKLHDLLAPDNCIYIKIMLGMYGLPHVSLITNELLEKRFNKHGYHQSKLVSGLWKHNWHPVWFTLVVDDFGVKYIGKEHTLNFQSVIESSYPRSTNWTGDRYIGIMLDWDFVTKKVHLSMPGYVAKALKLFQHTCLTAPQHSLFPTKSIIYGAKKQYSTEAAKSPPPWQKGQEVHPTSLRQISFPWSCHGPNSTLPHQCHCLAMRQPYPRHAIAHAATPRLPRNKRRCCHHLPHQ
ncbi:hypothetical protein ACHAW6_002855, partial [Cyclotella cf. meneghiniana]